MKNIRTIYNQFLALRNNLPEEKHVSKKYVDEFHILLKKLESITNSSLIDYFIKQSFLEHTSGIYRPGVGFKGFGELKCERGILLSKLDATLLLFSSTEEHPMGFNIPNDSEK